MGTIFHQDIPYSGQGTPNTWGEITGTLSQQTDLQTVLDTKYERALANKMGAKNLLPNNAISRTHNGITYIVNSDGSISASGTASDTSFLVIAGDGARDNSINGYTTQVFPLGMTVKNPTQIALGARMTDGTYATIPANSEYTFSKDVGLVYITVDNGATVNTTYYPMLVLPSDPDSTYEPYAKTNRELTMQGQTVTRLVSSASAGAQIRIPESGTDSRISASARSIIKPVCELTNNRKTRCTSFTVGEGYGTITVGEAISNKNIGFQIIKI